MFQLFIYFPFHTQQFKDFTGAKSTPFKTLAFQIFKQYTSCHYHQVINGNFNWKYPHLNYTVLAYSTFLPLAFIIYTWFLFTQYHLFYTSGHIAVTQSIDKY